MGPLMILRALVRLGPLVVDAVQAIRAARTSPPPPPRVVHSGRAEPPPSAAMVDVDEALRSLGQAADTEHFWDDALGESHCLYCYASRTSAAGSAQCPGPAKHPHRPRPS